MNKNSALYILMRTDLDSMNSGKAMAQAAHAANHFTYNWQGYEGVEDWIASGRGFGKTVTLSVDSEDELMTLVGKADEACVPCGVVLDPSYPVRDGRVTHVLPLRTCGYVFVPDYAALCFPPLVKLPLHP